VGEDKRIRCGIEMVIAQIGNSEQGIERLSQISKIQIEIHKVLIFKI
jgi:hypothetical protein